MKAILDFLGLSKPEPYAEAFGLKYFIHRRWTFLPRYLNGTLIFCAWYWETWSVDEHGTIDNRSGYPYDPREKWK